MKKLYSTLLIIFCFMVCKGQYVTIPDTAFVRWLNNNGCAQCLTVNQLDTTCPEVLNKRIINCSGNSVQYGNISNLQGIQYFKNLDTLICSFNIITSAFVMPGNLQYLDCSNNQLGQLGALPSSLTYLECYKNKLIILPPLPLTLLSLICDFNQLDSLPVLSPSLTYLNCDYNRITSLPALPPSLSNIYCAENQLTTLPSLPDSLNTLYADRNTNLSCMPVINKITYFSFAFTNIKCVPDYGQVFFSNPSIDSIPLCSISNPNNCAPVNSIERIEANENSLTIFPNPTHDIVNITLPQPCNNCVINVTDVTGRNINLFPNLSSGRTAILDLSGLASGIYFIRLSTAGETQTVKVVKVN